MAATPVFAAPAADQPVAPVMDGDRNYKSLLDAWKAADTPPGQSQALSIPLDRPVDSFRYTSPFGIRSDPFRGSQSFHSGVDLAAPVGTPVHATGDATVGRAGVAAGYGNLVTLEHGGGIETRYGHLSRILVKAGQRVRRGDVIGLVGSTGRSTGSHLHYEVRLADQAINPLAFMAPGDERIALNETVGTRAGSALAMGGPQAAGKCAARAARNCDGTGTAAR
ncbi:MAG: M23 family metallopeptidase [Sphingomonas bacterium]